MKGGLRYKRLKRKVGEELGDEGLEAFFIGTAKEMGYRAHRGSLSSLKADEYVLAVTSRAVHVIEMGGMGVFSAKLDGHVSEIPLGEASAALDDRVVTLDGRDFHVFPYHDEDAERFVQIVTAGPPPA